MINTAVIPVAGFGTRMLPASKSIPKEMLPLGDKPIIHYIVEECKLAGIKNIILVNHACKTSLEDYFDRDNELENTLEAGNKFNLLDEVKRITPSSVSISSIRQKQALGLGHAILAARPLVGNKSFAVLLPDVLLRNNSLTNNLEDMIKRYKVTRSSQILLEQVAKERVSNYGIVDGERVEDVPNRSLRLSNIVEKPDQDNAPSNLAVVGRYIFTPKIWQFLSKTQPGVGGEIQLTDAILELLKVESVYGVKMTGEARDCGCKAGYYQAFIEQALQTKEGADLVGFLSRLISEHNKKAKQNLFISDADSNSA